MDTYSLLTHALGEARIRQNEPLARYTTFKIGGPAEFFYVAQSVEELTKAFQTAKKAGIKFWILGGGTNTLISDAGLAGLVVKNEAHTIKIIRQVGQVKNGKSDVRQALIEAETGALMNQLVRFTCDQGFSGLEMHLGLPGTVGGALFMNSKWTHPTAYVGDVLFQAKILTPDGTIKLVNKDYFNFGYDQSILQKTRETVVAAIFLLKKDDPEKSWARAHASMDYRKQTQPMGIQTAGCTFRNIAPAQALRIGTPNQTTSAGYLIDAAGLKGTVHGKAKFSDKHANFIINNGGATATDVKWLIDKAKSRVQEKFKVAIEPEIVLLGKFN